MKRVLLFVLVIGLFGLLGVPRLVNAAVDLLYFIAEPQTTSILLYWETATEIDNAGFQVHRGLDPQGPFEPVSPFIPSGSDPFIGHFYQYEDSTVTIGIQYYYVLKIINTNGTSEYTLPVSAIILASTATRTMTATPTKTLDISPSPTLTYTATGTTTFTPSSTIPVWYSPITATPSSTVTLTPIPTATRTPTPTTTLGAFDQVVNGFPVSSLTQTDADITSVISPDSAYTPEFIETGTQETRNSLPTVILSAVLWLILSMFLVFYIRRVTKNADQNS